MRKAVALLLLLFGLSLISSSAQSQRDSRRPTFGREDFTPPDRFHPGAGRKGEFTFARLRYGGYGRGGWTTDYPKADIQFIYGLRNWVGSGLKISDNPTVVSMDEESLFRYPFIYVVEPGTMELSTEDAAHLREYLDRGGFMMLDDFWGAYEWENVVEQMHKVFPERPIRELSLDHPIFHCYFDIDEVVQVPNVGNIIYRGRTDEKGGTVPYYMAITDDDDRVMVFIARNADNGDAWEWIDEPQYPLKYGLAAYRLGMNLIVYAMTH